jgi:hypothetical protein
MNMMKSLISSALALAAISAIGTAQSQVSPLSVQSAPRHATIDMATGVLTRDSQDKAASLVQVWTNTDSSGFYSTWAGSAQEWLDWGVLSVTSGSDIVGSYQFAYATTVLDTTAFGPGASLCTNFYNGALGFCGESGLGITPDTSYCFSALPASSDGVTAAGWIITVTLTGGFEFQLPAGPFGYALGLQDSLTGPLLCYAGSIGGGADGNGQVDDFDVYVPDVASGTCGTYYFGGVPSNYSSWWLYISTADGTATTASHADYCGSGINAAAGTFSVTSEAVLGGTLGISLTHSRALALLYAYSSSLTFPFHGGEILINFTDPGGELLGGPAAFGSPAVFALPVPINLVFCGATIYIQGVSVGGGFSLMCASAVTIGF